jgi:hypothetical protein
MMLSLSAGRKNNAGRTANVNEPTLGRRQILAAAGGIFMGQLIGTSSAATLDWRTVAPAEASFAGDLEARLDKAIAEKRVWNLHGVIVVRSGRLVLERYFDGQDDARGRPLGVVSFKPIRFMICARRPKASSACCTGSRWPPARCRHRNSR